MQAGLGGDRLAGLALQAAEEPGNDGAGMGLLFDAVEAREVALKEGGQAVLAAFDGLGSEGGVGQEGLGFGVIQEAHGARSGPGRLAPQDNLLKTQVLAKSLTVEIGRIDHDAHGNRDRHDHRGHRPGPARLRTAQQPGPEGKAEQTKQRRGRGGPGPAEAGSDLSKPPLPKDDGEKRILDAIDQARQGERYANVSTADGRLLRQLTEAIGAKRVVELGTSTGESGLWFSLALRKTGGHLYTHDIDPGRIAVARENFKKAGVEDLITIVEGDAHETAPKNTEPIDVLFIDAEKDGLRRLPEGTPPATSAPAA